MGRLETTGLQDRTGFTKVLLPWTTLRLHEHHRRELQGPVSTPHPSGERKGLQDQEQGTTEREFIGNNRWLQASPTQNKT